MQVWSSIDRDPEKERGTVKKQKREMKHVKRHGIGMGFVCAVLQYTEQNRIDAWGCLAGGDEVGAEHHGVLQKNYCAAR